MNLHERSGISNQRSTITVTLFFRTSQTRLHVVYFFPVASNRSSHFPRGDTDVEEALLSAHYLLRLT